MQRARAVIYLEDHTEPLSDMDISSFEFRCGVEDIYPTGVLRLSDPTGEVLSNFKGCAIGTTVKVTVIESSPIGGPEDGSGINTQAVPTISLCPLMVASVAETTQDKGMLSGILEMYLVHPWKFYQDFSSHLYKGIPNSEIIKKVLSSDFRGFSFSINNNRFERSDEDGTVPRYKCGISDKDFIVDNLLPYTTINGIPPLFWIDDENYPNLRSIANLFGQKPSAIVFPWLDGIEDQELLQKTATMYGQDVEFFAYSEMKIKVGDEDINAFIKPIHSKAIIDINVLSGGAAIGRTSNKIKVADNDSNQVGSKLPIVAHALAGDTDCKILVNRPVKDQSSFLTNTSKPYLNIFRLEVTGNFCGDIVKVGSLVHVYNSIDGKSLLWTSGQWLVKDVIHRVKNTEKQEVTTTLILCRPSFMYNKENTNIPEIDSYLEV